MSRKPHPYASSATLSRVLRTFEKAGITVGTVRLDPDGTIEIHSGPGPLPASPDNDFDRMEAQGLI